MHIPLGQLAARQDELATDRTILAICRSGVRSDHVMQALRRAGYDAQNLDGGMHAWEEAGLPFVAEDGGPSPRRLSAGRWPAGG